MPAIRVGLIAFLFVGAIVAVLSQTLHRARQLAVARREWLCRSQQHRRCGDRHGCARSSRSDEPGRRGANRWTAAEAAADVFPRSSIINDTRQPVEDPCGKVLAMGRIVGLQSQS